MLIGSTGCVIPVSSNVDDPTVPSFACTHVECRVLMPNSRSCWALVPYVPHGGLYKFAPFVAIDPAIIEGPARRREAMLQALMLLIDAHVNLSCPMRL